MLLGQTIKGITNNKSLFEISIAIVSTSGKSRIMSSLSSYLSSFLTNRDTPPPGRSSLIRHVFSRVFLKYVRNVDCCLTLMKEVGFL